MKLYAIKDVETGQLFSMPEGVVFATDDIKIAQRFAHSRMRKLNNVCIVVEFESIEEEDNGK